MGHDDLHSLALDLRHHFGDYVYYASDKCAADVDDACAAWLHARGHHNYVYHHFVDAAAVADRDLFSTYTGDHRLTAASIRLVYDFVVEYARDVANFDSPGPACAALLNYADTHGDTAGHQVTQ